MNFFSRFFGAGRYTRAASRDFRPEDLPDTRVKLFFDALGIRWSAMVGQNLFYLLFWLPAILWSGVNLLTLVQMLADAPAGADVGARVYSLAFTYLLVLWPLIAITGPATAGASYVSRNWARGQHSFMVSDFMEHARKNWKQALAVSTVTGALPVLLLFLWRFYGALAESMSGLFIIPEVIVFIAVILWLLMLQVVYTMMVTYKLTLRQLLGNAMRMALGKLPLFLGVRLLTAALPLAMLIVLLYFPGQATFLLTVGGFFYMVFGLALNRLLYASLANALCETYINPNIGAPVNIGMRSQTPPPGEEDFE